MMLAAACSHDRQSWSLNNIRKLSLDVFIHFYATIGQSLDSYNDVVLPISLIDSRNEEFFDYFFQRKIYIYEFHIE